MTFEKRKFDTGFEKGFIKKSSKGEYYAFCSACDEHNELDFSPITALSIFIV